MPVMRGVEFLIFAAAVAAQVSVVCSGNFPKSILTLERAFPANQKVELEALRARDRARHARILQGVIGGVVDFSVAGSSDPYIGLYYTKVKLGSPPKEFNVQIDTGSDILWVTCNTCNDCPQSSGIGIELNFFDAASSSTASLVSCSDPICASVVQAAAAVSECSSQSNQCGYSFRYGDGSGTSGYYLTDLMYFDTIMGASLVANSSAPIVFGCSTYQSGDLTKTDRAIDGIIGFGQHDLSVISQLSSRGITPKVFSHCLKGEGNGGGILVLGEILDPSIVYSPLVPSQYVGKFVKKSDRILPSPDAKYTNLYIKNLDPDVTEEIFKEKFSEFGKIVSLVITKDDNGASRGFGFVNFDNPDDARRALEAMNGSQLGSKVLYVARAQKKAEREQILRRHFEEKRKEQILKYQGSNVYIKNIDDDVTENELREHFRQCGTITSAKLMRDDKGISRGFGFVCFSKPEEANKAVNTFHDLVLKDKIFVYDLARQRLGWTNYDCSMSVNVSITTAKDEFINAGQLSVSISSRNALFKIIPMSISLFMHFSLFIGFLLL